MTADPRENAVGSGLPGGSQFPPSGGPAQPWHQAADGHWCFIRCRKVTDGGTCPCEGCMTASASRSPHVRDARGRRRGLHGTPSGYSNGRCRCDPCTWAWASQSRGDRPAVAEPRWLDEWLTTGATL